MRWRRSRLRWQRNEDRLRSFRIRTKMNHHPRHGSEILKNVEEFSPQYQEENADESLVTDNVENDVTVDTFLAKADIVSEALDTEVPGVDDSVVEDVLIIDTDSASTKKAERFRNEFAIFFSVLRWIRLHSFV